MRRTKLTAATVVVTLVVLGVVAGVSFLRVRDETPKPQATPATGAELFRSHGCADCHHADSRDKKIGPGLEGILDRETLPASRRPATRANVRRQLVDPYRNMPSYADELTDRQMGRLLDYLETR